MCRNGCLWTFGVNLNTAVQFADPDFLFRVQTFGDLATFSIDFCIFYAECPPYFYFRFVWPTDLDPYVDNFHHVWSWYDHPLPSYSVMVVDTSRDLVTLTFDLLTLNSCCTWLVTWSTLPPSLTTLCLSVLELWVIAFPVGTVTIESAYAATAHAPNHVTHL